LWVSEQIIRKHHGTVRVRSSSSGATGTVFSVFFPSTGIDAEGMEAERLLGDAVPQDR
jgi:signal transduction histidine kinase